MKEILEFIKRFSLQRVIFTVALVLVCLVVVKVVLAVFDRLIKRSKLNDQVVKILRVVIKAFLLFTAVIIVLSSLGISVSSLVATLSIVGVALSLAIQDFLSNVFGGFQIVSNHPFQVGDYIEAAGTSGSVCEVGLFYTKLTTPDKKLVQIPNSKVANDNIINYSNSPDRRLEFLIATGYDNDVEKVKAVLTALIDEHPMVLHEEGKTPAVHVMEFRDSDILYTARAWCENKNYWTVYFDVMDAIKPTLDQHGITFSYPHVNVHMAEK